MCHGADATALYAVTAAEAAQHFVLAEVDADHHVRLAHHIETLWGRGKCQLVRCDGCGFVRADPFIAGDADFYNLAYHGKAKGRYPTWRWEYDQTLSALPSLASSGRRVLEIGAGNGAFVKRLIELGTEADHLCATEFSDYGCGEIKRAGITCLQDDFRSASFERYRGTFDVVCLFQVLEHMDRLDEVFVRLRELTRASADIFIAVPNDHRINFNEKNGGLLDMPPVHISRWNQRCFDIIGRRYGLQVVDHRTEKESLIARGADLAAQLYLRRAQVGETSLANRIERMYRRKPALSTKALRIAGVAAVSLLHLSAHAKLARRDLGSSQWVRLVKHH